MAINVADNFSYKGGKPLDSRIQYNTVSDMVSTPVADLYDGCLAYSKDTKKNYQYDSANTVDPTLGKWRELQTGGGGTDYTAGDGIDITNNVISADAAPSEDMSEIVSPLPSIPTRGHKYSTEEQVVGEWIDGKPLYQKTIEFRTSSTNNTTVNIISLDGIRLKNFYGLISDITELNCYVNSEWNSRVWAGKDSGESVNYLKNSVNGYTNLNSHVTIQYTKTTD